MAGPLPRGRAGHEFYRETVLHLAGGRLRALAAAAGADQAKLVLLLAASLIFYGHNRWPLLLLLLTYCVVDWLAGAWIARARRPGWVLTLGVGFNLGVLAYWKYTPLLLKTLAKLAANLHLPVPEVPAGDWSIPFGISFYTFTGIAYLVDVYRGTLLPETNLFRFTLYKTFFPQLVAGPILRPTDFLTKLQPACLPDRPEAPLEATLLLARGYFKKVVLADRLALAIDPFFQHVGGPATAGVWAALRLAVRRCKSISTSPAIPTSHAAWGCGLAFAGRRILTCRTWRRRCRSSGIAGT